MLNASDDLIRGALLWQQWSYMALNDIRMHYRRSVLGPFWLCLNTLILTAVLGVVYSLLFGMPASEYVPYFATGYLAWQLISAFFNEGAQTFIQHGAMIRNVNMPLSFFAMKVTFKQILVFLHQAVILIPIYFLLPVELNAAALWAVPAIFLYALNGFALCLLVGMLSARYRDLPNLLMNFLQICFFVTPIFWPAQNIQHSLVLKLNIFYHFLEIFRAPMLGNVPALEHWLVSLGASTILLSLAFLVFRTYRMRIVHTL